MKIYSPDFREGEGIPQKFTQEGEDISPALIFEDVPAAAQSLVLIADDPDAPDPDAPKRIWLHWLMVNIPAGTTRLEAGCGKLEPIPEGAREGVNDGGVVGWSGPMPPIGRHRYYFHLYALNTSLEKLPATFGRHDVEAAMAGHVIDEAHMHGTYLALANR